MNAIDFLLIENTPQEELSEKECYQGLSVNISASYTGGSSSIGGSTTGGGTTDGDSGEQPQSQSIGFWEAIKLLLDGVNEEYAANQKPITEESRKISASPRAASDVQTAGRARGEGTALMTRALPAVFGGILRRFAGPLSIPLDLALSAPEKTVALCQVAQTFIMYIKAMEDLGTELFYDPLVQLKRIADSVEVGLVHTVIDGDDPTDFFDTSYLDEHFTELENILSKAFMNGDESTLANIEEALLALDVKIDIGTLRAWLKSKVKQA